MTAGVKYVYHLLLLGMLGATSSCSPLSLLDSSLLAHTHLLPNLFDSSIAASYAPKQPIDTSAFSAAKDRFQAEVAWATAEVLLPTSPKQQLQLFTYVQ
jgi:hypothetical protein